MTGKSTNNYSRRRRCKSKNRTSATQKKGRPNADVEFQKRMVTCEVFSSKVDWRVPRKPIFGTKFDPQNGPRSPRGHPKPGSDTERRSQSASSASGDAPGAQLEEVRGPVGGPPEPWSLKFSVKEIEDFQFLRLTASSAPATSNRHQQSDASIPFWPPAPLPPEL